MNVTNVLLNGNAITGSKWTTSGTNIYYNTGNVGIGTTNPTNILQVGGGTRLSISNASGVTLIGTSDTEPNTRIGIFGASHPSAAGQISYVAQSTGRHVFFTTNTFIERMIIDSTGIVYINNGNVDNGSAKLVVAGSDSNGVCAYFYHPNRSQGIGIVYDGLRALGGNANQSISMTPRGAGTFNVNGPMLITSYATQLYYLRMRFMHVMDMIQE